MSNTVYSAYQPDKTGAIPYSKADNAVWRDLVAQQLPNTAKFCARPYLDGFTRLDLPLDRIPQCAEVTAMLAPFTGWRVTPVPAVIGFEQFFAMLANREFPAASFIRNRDDFNYITEPDIFHEIFGHMPLLSDPRFAQFSHAIGKAGLQAEPTDYSWLIRLYWFSIEFGLTRENDAVKALGSGLASSPTELIWSTQSDTPERREFIISDIMRTPYRIDIHQPIYFVLDSIDDLFAAADRDLLADVRAAQSKGLFAPTYPPKQKAC